MMGCNIRFLLLYERLNHIQNFRLSVSVLQPMSDTQVTHDHPGDHVYYPRIGRFSDQSYQIVLRLKLATHMVLSITSDADLNTLLASEPVIREQRVWDYAICQLLLIVPASVQGQVGHCVHERSPLLYISRLIAHPRLRQTWAHLSHTAPPLQPQTSWPLIPSHTLLCTLMLPTSPALPDWSVAAGRVVQIIILKSLKGLACLDVSLNI